ncbi:MAG: class I SAM-dependent methyltransferase [Pirellulales bacterium]
MALLTDPAATRSCELSVPRRLIAEQDDARCTLCRGRMTPAHAHPWLLQCASCGLVRVYPVPDADVLASIYNEQYFHTFGYAVGDEWRYRTIRRESACRLLTVAERHFALGSLLDVGSGLGDMLAAASGRGWKATGVEPNMWAAKRADHVARGATHTCGIEDFEPGDATFDLVTCVDVIEHLRRPDETLSRYFKWLRPGGGLLMTTPDIGSLLARIMGPQWPHFHIDHLWYFNRATLTALVEQAGFEVCAWRCAPKVFNIAYIAGIFEHNAQNCWLQAAARTCLRFLPGRLLRQPLPTIREGQLIIARRPPC